MGLTRVRMKRGLIGFALLLFVVYLIVALRRGVRVEVQNVGTSGLDDVVVTVTGVHTELGTIDAGDTATARLSCKGEAGLVEITWKVDGRKGYGHVECYFEDSGYNGTVLFVIDGLAVREAKADIDVGFY